MEPIGYNTTTASRKPLRVKALGNIGNAPSVKSDSVSGEWVRFGARNLFPEFCAALYDNCSPLAACIDTMAQFVAGSGWSFTDSNGEPMLEAHRAWAEVCGEQGEWYHLSSTAHDLSLMNTFAWEAVRSRVGIAMLQHLDVCRVRAGKRKDGRIPAYWFSSNWEKASDNRYKPIEIPAWGSGGAKELIYDRAYKQLRDYYGEPHWMAAMVDAEVLSRIPVFNRTQLDGGFKPSVHAHLQSNKDDADLDQLDEDFEMTFTGEDGKPYILTVGAINETLTITKLERGDHAGELDATRRVSKEEIYHSYGIPPILMGASVNTGLSGRGLAIEEELSLFQTAKVRPRQRRIEEAAKKVLRDMGIEVPQVRILPLVPFEPAADNVLQRMTYMRRTTVNEDRIANKFDPLPANDERGNKMLMEITAAKSEANA